MNSAREKMDKIDLFCNKEQHFISWKTAISGDDMVYILFNKNAHWSNAEIPHYQGNKIGTWAPHQFH